MAINQSLTKSNEAYAHQISELKKTIESIELSGTSQSPVLTYDMIFELDKLDSSSSMAYGKYAL